MSCSRHVAPPGLVLGIGMMGGMVGEMVGRMVRLATHQTPQIDDNTPARGGIAMNNGGLAGG